MHTHTNANTHTHTHQRRSGCRNRPVSSIERCIFIYFIFSVFDSQKSVAHHLLYKVPIQKTFQNFLLPLGQTSMFAPNHPSKAPPPPRPRPPSGTPQARAKAVPPTPYSWTPDSILATRASLPLTCGERPIHVCVCVCVRVRVCIYMYICKCVNMCICIRICIHGYVCIY